MKSSISKGTPRGQVPRLDPGDLRLDPGGQHQDHRPFQALLRFLLPPRFQGQRRSLRRFQAQRQSRRVAQDLRQSPFLEPCQRPFQEPCQRQLLFRGLLLLARPHREARSRQRLAA